MPDPFEKRKTKSDFENLSKETLHTPSKFLVFMCLLSHPVKIIKILLVYFSAHHWKHPSCHPSIPS